MTIVARSPLGPTADAATPRSIPSLRGGVSGSIIRWAQRGRLGASRRTDLGRYTGSRV